MQDPIPGLFLGEASLPIILLFSEVLSHRSGQLHPVFVSFQKLLR
jgi:hypothetical protein